MNFHITKEYIEEQLGYKIQYFKLEPLYDGDTCIELSVNVVPIQKVDKIDVKFTIEKENNL